MGLQLCEWYRHVQRGAVVPVVQPGYDNRMPGSHWRWGKPEHESVLPWVWLRRGAPSQLDAATVSPNLQPQVHTVLRKGYLQTQPLASTRTRSGLGPLCVRPSCCWFGQRCSPACARVYAQVVWREAGRRNKVARPSIPRPSLQSRETWEARCFRTRQLASNGKLEELELPSGPSAATTEAVRLSLSYVGFLVACMSPLAYIGMLISAPLPAWLQAIRSVCASAQRS